jgi:4-hydroxy-tetrahydrodipicolinate reductase
MNERPTYKVIVWAPGYLGSGVIKEILKRPEFELVGVLAYSAHKNGMDVGEMLGIGPIGVKMTTNQKEIFNLKADCVVHTGTNMMDDTPRNKEVIRLLESGKNVVASPSYHFPQLRGQQFVDMLNDACKRGNASLYGTGIHPGVLCERLAILLTSFVNQIDYIRCQEYFDLTRVDEKMLKACTMGFTMEKTERIRQKIEMGAGVPYYFPAVAQACHILGHDVERIEVNSTFTPAKEDLYLEASGMTVRKGNVACWEHTYTGIVNGAPFFYVDEIFYVGDYCPVETRGDHYRIIIEGKPTSVSMQMDIMASVEKNKRLHDNDPTTPGYYATAVTLIQAIPIACAAKPGIVYPETFAHYAKDYRNLVSNRP